MATAAAVCFGIRVPGTGGYVHLGDTLLYAASRVLGGRWGAVVGCLYGALADLLAGSPAYVPMTCILKTGMGWLAGNMLTKYRGLLRIPVLAGIGAGMALGYFLYTWLFYGMAVALNGLLYDTVQAAASALLAQPVLHAMERAKSIQER